MLSFSHYLIPLVYLSLFLSFLHIWRRNHTSPRRKIPPPSPPKLPVIGNLHQLGSFPHRSLQSLSRHYGPLMQLHLGRIPVLVVSSADAASEVMKTHDLIFSNRPKLSIPSKIFYGSRDLAFSPYGEYWRQMRSICVLQLLSLRRVQSFRRVREEETTIMVDKIQSSPSVVNLSDVLVSLTNDVVCRVALGRKYNRGKEGVKFKTMLRGAAELLGTFCVGDYIPWMAWIDRVNGLDDKLEKTAKLIDEFLESVVEERRQRGGNSEVPGSNFVDILLEVQRKHRDDLLVDNHAIKAIIFDIFAAGTDTTSTALEWTVTELIKNPRSMKILQNEVRQVVKDKEEIEEQDLEKMQYLKAVIKESLRLHPPVPLLVPRESTQDIKLMGYDISKGTQVMINACAIARDPTLWENPDEFQPERFLNTSTDFKGLNFELIPFGAGRRGCPGIAFAVALEELALVKLVHKFNFGLPGGAENVDLDISETTGITVRKKLPLLVVASPCHS